LSNLVRQHFAIHECRRNLSLSHQFLIAMSLNNNYMLRE
jgi:hypothetical protein